MARSEVRWGDALGGYEFQRGIARAERRRPIDARRHERVAAAQARGTHTSIQWWVLQRLTGDRCVRCKTPRRHLVGQTLTKDHIRPVSCGGSDSILNIQPLCRPCNTAKHRLFEGAYITTEIREWVRRYAQQVVDEIRR